MLRQRAREIAAFTVAVDATLLLGCFLASIVLRIRVLPLISNRFGSVDASNYSWLPLLLIPVTIWLMWSRGLYASMRIKSYSQIAGEVFMVFCLVVPVLGGFIFAFQLKETSRTLVGLYLGTSFIVTLVGKLWLRYLQRVIRSRSLNSRNMIIVGQGERAAEVVRELEANPELGFKLLGIVSDHPLQVPTDVQNLGRLRDLETIVRANVVDAVFLALPVQDLEAQGRTIVSLEEMGVRIHLRVDFFPTLISRTCFESLGALPVLTLTTVPHNLGSLLAKRTLDILASTVGLVMMFPVLVVCAIAVRLGSAGPVFFRQVRVGLNGRRFVLYKFRSMCEGEERARVDRLLRNEVSGPVFKMKCDPRVTRTGRWLRRLSLDELPQLWNVLKGDMSLVGPRPPLPSEVSGYEAWHRRRLSIRPGLTCLWQVNGRSEIDFDRWMAMDMYYIDHWSLALDLKILLRTVPAVLMARGAH